VIVISAEYTMSKHQICVNRVPADRTSFIKTLRFAGRLDLKQALDLTFIWSGTVIPFWWLALICRLHNILQNHCVKQVQK
jgi:hypothetical protein